MKKFVVFLRGINVSGKNLIKMDALKSTLLLHGFKNVKTYIQSGNILVETNLKNTAVQQQFEEILLNEFQLNVPVFVLSISDLEKALQNNPFPENTEPNKVFITFLNEKPANDLVEKLASIDFGDEVFTISDKVLYFHVPNGMGASKMNNNFFENKLKVTATGRNINTINKMIALAKS